MKIKFLFFFFIFFASISWAEENKDIDLVPEIKIKKNEEVKSDLSKQSKEVLQDIYLNRLREKKYSKKNVSINRGDSAKSNLKDYDIVEGSSNRFDIKVQKPNKILEKRLVIHKKAFDALEFGQYEVAIILYKKILKTKKNDQDALLGLAQSYHRLGDIEEAKKYYSLIIKNNIKNEIAVNNFLVLVSEESPKVALQEFLKLDRVLGYNSVLKGQISYIYSLLGDYINALKYIDYALGLDSGNPSYIYNKAVILDNLKLKKESLLLYSKILSSGSYNSIGVSARMIKDRINFLSKG